MSTRASGRTTKRTDKEPTLIRMEQSTKANGYMTLKKVKALKDRDGRQVAELFILLPTRKQLPDYYKQIAHPIDFDSIGKCLNKQGGYQTVWKFLLACELMLSNAQVYNEEHSELWEDAATLRKAFIAELKKVYPGHPYPKPMSV